MNFESEKRIEFLTSEKKNRTERKNLLKSHTHKKTAAQITQNTTINIY